MTTWIPFWNSVDAVRRIHSDFELASIIFFVLLALFDALAHWAKDTAKERKFAEIGVWCFLVAVICEVVAYPYGQRNDTLSERVVVSLSEKSEQAANNAHNAVLDSGSAKTKADAATFLADGAVAKADAAVKEADSFERDIVSARTQAADAESHLADALQRAAHAEAELNKLRAPRSLIHIPSLVSALRLYTGTTYKLQVSQDDESIHFAKLLDGILNEAGWIRNPSGFGLDLFGEGPSVPICISTGIETSVQSNLSPEAVSLLPADRRPTAAKAAETLTSAIGPHISPEDPRNVMAEIHVDTKPTEGPITLCIGKKP